MNLANVDLRLLRVFHGLVEHGGFAGAQAELGLSLSTLSVHLSNLEKRLGMTLCERGRRGFRLTEKGERVYRATCRLFEAIDGFCEEAAALKKTLTGELSIGVADNTITDPACPIAAAIDRFERRDNDVHLRVVVDRPTALAHALADGRIDLAVSSFPRTMPGLVLDTLYVETSHVYCGRGHPLFARERPPGPAEVAASRLAARTYRLESDIEALAGTTHKASVESVEAHAHLILSGHYIGFLPDHYAARFVAEDRLRPVAPDRYVAHHEIALARPAARRADPLPRLFADDLCAAAGLAAAADVAA